MQFISRYSAQLLATCVLIGFLFPNFSNSLLPALPAVLFFLMVCVVLSLKLNTLVRDLARWQTWNYALWHSLGCTILALSSVWLFGVEPSIYLAIAAACATGSLFASPAIVRSLGFDAQRCMAMTIASTLTMPAVLLVNAALFDVRQGEASLQLDMGLYLQRLVIFIVLPMLISLLSQRFVSQQLLTKALTKLQPITMLLVFFFPLGLMGAFRQTFDQSPQDAGHYLLVASWVCLTIFTASYWLYRRGGKALAMTAAITATNRNVLLTYSITGAFLGVEYLIYMGALQLPIYLLPLIVRGMNRILERRAAS